MSELVLQPGETCDNCGGEFVQGTKKRTVTYQGHTSDKFDMPGFYCTQCGEGIVGLRDMKLLQKAQHLLKARTEITGE